MSRHRPAVRSAVGETPEGVAWIYEARCGCGWTGQPHYQRVMAVAERDGHRVAVAAPQSRRCRDPRAHDAQWWDACALCAGQLPLPGMEQGLLNLN